MNQRKLFRISMAIKAFDGFIQSLLGFLLFFFSPEKINNFVKILIQRELTEDPNDSLSHYFLKHNFDFTPHIRNAAIFFLLSHGIVKIFLSAALWKEKMWAFPLGIFIFGLFTIYQTYQFIVHPSPILFALVVVDIIVLYLIWKEYRLHKKEIRKGF